MTGKPVVTMDLFTRLAGAQVASCSCMTKTPDYEWHAEDCRYRVLHEALLMVDQLKEYEQIDGVRTAADRRAIRRWRDAAPGREFILPDHADLCVYLLEQLEAARWDSTAVK